MLVPLGLSKSERAKLEKDNARFLNMKARPRPAHNKHPGLRQPKKAQGKKSGSGSS